MRYQRDISHCDVSTYVREVTVKSVRSADNSDNLDVILFNEIAWQIVAKKGSYKPGDKVCFIPPDSVLPLELSEKAEITKYLSNGRVRVTKLRNNRSEGLILPMDMVREYLPFIMKWEDPPTVEMRGDALRSSEIPIRFIKYYKMPNILNEPNTFEIGENISIQEKIHGTSARFAFMKNPVTDEYQAYVGSHNVVLKENDDNIYWATFKKYLKDKIPYNLVFFGEIFGKGIQHLHYDRKTPEVVIFDIVKNGEYLPQNEVAEICSHFKISHIKCHNAVFESVDKLREIADSPSEFTSSHEREGIVVKSLDRPGVMAKCIGFNYLEKKNRKERH